MRYRHYLSLLIHDYRMPVSNALCVCFSTFLLVSLQAYGATVSEPVSLKIDYSNPVPVNIRKYGLNGALLGSKIGYNDNELVDIYEKIGPVFSRFPGGTIGNFYNWKTGRFSCYRKPNERFKLRIGRMNRTLEKKKTTYLVDTFFDFVKKTNADFTYVLNTMCDSPGNNAELIKHMKEKGVLLNYIEMGNETFSSSYKWAYENAEAYLNSAKENYSAIKFYYPEAKVGLAVSPMSFSGKHHPDKHGIPGKSWPARMREYDQGSAKATFADALIIHVYGHPYSHRWSLFDPETNKEHYQAVMQQFNDKFQISMDYLTALGKNKPIWITEWGVSSSSPERRTIFRKYKKSAYQALYMASALASISLNKNIEIANYHNVSDLWDVAETGYKLTPAANILALFIDLAKRTDHVYRVDITSNFSQNNPQTNGIKTLLFNSDTESYLLVINEQDKHFTINTLDAGIQKYKNYSIEEKHIDNGIFKHYYKQLTQLNNSDKINIEIKPYSILKIKLR